MAHLRVLQINTSSYGSTGTIMKDIGNAVHRTGGEALYAYPYTRRDKYRKINDNAIIIGSWLSKGMHLLLNNITGLNGCFSIVSTLIFLRKVKTLSPNIIQLHNLHNCYINLPLLFRFLKKSKIPVIWTLHDCWALTGQCTYFSMVGCYKWKSGCYECPQIRKYPKSYIDQTKLMYKLKKKWFTGIPNCCLVTPSHWLADCVKESFLKNYPVHVIQNGIDLEIFKPRSSDFREIHLLHDKYIILGVAFGWGARKGFDIFIKLCGILPEEYHIVLVGLSEMQIKLLPTNCLGLGLTSGPIELAEIYSSVDIFVNPSQEETMGLVTVEALACGTPVVTSNLTAVPELVTPTCGVIVTNYSAKAFADVLLGKPRFEAEKCTKRANEFNKDKAYLKYLNLYAEYQ